MFRLEPKRPHRHANLFHRDGIVAEWPTAREPVTSRRCEQRIVGRILERKVIPLLWRSASQELIKDVERALFVGEPSKTRLVERKCEHLGTLDAAALVEVQLEPTAVARCVRVEKRFRVAKRVEKRVERFDLT